MAFRALARMVGRMTAPKPIITRNMLHTIRRMHQKGIGKPTIAKKLDLTVYRLRQVMVEMGLEWSGLPAAPWTEQENEIIKENQEMCLTTVRRQLKRAGFVRSEGAIQQHFIDLGVKGKATGDNLTLCDVARLLGVCEQTVSSWIKGGKLKARKAHGIRTKSEHAAEREPLAWHISDTDIGEFLVSFRLDWEMKKIPKASQTLVIDLIQHARSSLAEIAHRDQRSLPKSRDDETDNGGPQPKIQKVKFIKERKPAHIGNAGNLRRKAAKLEKQAANSGARG